MCVKYSDSDKFLLIRNVTVDVVHLSEVSERRIVAGAPNVLDLEGVGLQVGDKMAVVPAEESCPSLEASYFDVYESEGFHAAVVVEVGSNSTYKVCYKFAEYPGGDRVRLRDGGDRRDERARGAGGGARRADRGGLRRSGLRGRGGGAGAERLVRGS